MLLAALMSAFLLGDWTSEQIMWATIFGVSALAIIGILAVFASFFRLWIQCYLTDTGISMLNLIGMVIRKVNPKVIVKSKIMAVTAGITDEDGVTRRALEAHFLAKGDVPLVILALIAARKAENISLTFSEAAAIDLAGRDVLESVKTSVYPKVINCPKDLAGSASLDAMAKNGVQLKVQARVTVRADLQELIGGATEETIIARVGEGIVSAIGMSESHGEVLENPDRISKAVLARHLDQDTAFEIVSIDIADIDVGENIGARLAADQAEADTHFARAAAERRRAMAAAEERENLARIVESQAKVVEAEAEVPLALADAFRQGKLSIMDYHKLKNLQADTEMRQAVAQRQTTDSASAGETT